jgi:hypothetical protein
MVDYISSGPQRERDIYDAQIADIKLITPEQRLIRQSRRSREMDLWRTYSRPGVWDEDFDKYQEEEYIETVGEYQISVYRQGLYSWNGYVILPADHYIVKLGLSYMELPWNTIADITYGNPKNTDPRKFGFDNMHERTAKQEGRPFSYISFEENRKTCLELVKWFKYFTTEKFVGKIGITRLFEASSTFPEINKLVQEFKINVIGSHDVEVEILAKKFWKMLTPSEIIRWNDPDYTDVTHCIDKYGSCDKELVWVLFKKTLISIKNRGYCFIPLENDSKSGGHRFTPTFKEVKENQDRRIVQNFRVSQKTP